MENLMATFRAANIPSEPGSTSGGIRLTNKDNQHLADGDLRAKAVAEAAAVGAEGEVVIGDWTE
jgi:hypothetical protein